jgi:hypothetical protein
MKHLIPCLLVLTLHINLRAQTQALFAMQDLLTVMQHESGLSAYPTLGYSQPVREAQLAPTTNDLIGATIHYEFDDCALELTLLSDEQLSLRAIYPNPHYDGQVQYTFTRLENGEELVEFTNRYGQQFSCYHDFTTYSVTLLTETGHWTDVTVGSFSLETISAR